MMHPSSSSFFPPPLLFLSSSSTSSAPSCAHSVKRQRLRRFSDAPPLTSIPLPEALPGRTRSPDHPSLGSPTSPTSLLGIFCFFGVIFSPRLFSNVCFVNLFFRIARRLRGRDARRRLLTSLTWDSTSEVIVLPAPPAVGSDSVRPRCASAEPTGSFFFRF